MELILAECGEKEKIAEFLDSIISKTKIHLTERKKYEIIEDIHQNLGAIIKDEINIMTILSRVFRSVDISKYNNRYMRSKL